MKNVDLKYLRYESLRLAIKYMKNKRKNNPKKIKKVADIIYSYLLQDVKNLTQE